jgi:(1->4)-alpha-D-glucan 1-alpha-D-glucosylmutase
LALERLGGWGEHVVALPEGDWHELLTDRVVPGGLVRLADLLATYPVALLARAEDG